MIKCYLIEPVLSGDSKIAKWRNPVTLEEHGTVYEFAPGAMYFLPWIERRIAELDPESRKPSWTMHYHLGPDGRVLGVLTPGGAWIIDSRCSNCDRKDDNTHHCWVRHGVAPMITVDKIGNTCAAGAGSIICGDYHGFLRNGELVAV